MQPEDVQDQKIEQMLREIAFEDQQITAEIQKAQQQGPNPGPNLERMYTAILRENFTKDEWSAIKKDEGLKKRYDTVKEQVWYPTTEQLTDYINGEITDEELKDQIQYHLEIDRCKGSLRLKHWLEVKAAVVKAARAAQEGVEDVVTRAQALGAFVKHDFVPQLSVLGAAEQSEAAEFRTIILTDEMELTEDRERDVYSCTSKSWSKGTVVAISVISDESNTAWRRFVVLWDSFKGEVMSDCERFDPKELEDATRKHSSIVCEVVNVEELVDKDVEDLQQSWEWTREHDPEAKTEWKSFAVKLSQSAFPALRECGDQIQGQVES
ncbi:hypothetical protein N9F76_00665 [bacterium]|nr:hypothetical protein [bacterium]